MADEYDSIDDVLDDPSIDSQALAAVASALTGLTFLDPATADVAEPMPADTWARLSAALAAEAAVRAAMTHDNVVLFPEPGELAPSRRSRGMRWAGGLVAASVAIIAVGIAVSTLTTTGSSDVMVAGEAAVPAAAAKSASVPPLPEPSNAVPAQAGQSDVTAASVPVQPAKVVMASNVNYTRAGLNDQVTSLLDSVDVHNAEEAEAMPAEPLALPVDDGFTASVDTLRACLLWLAKSAQAQALVVDRARYEGSAAGVIVAPAAQIDPATTPPPTTTLETPSGTLDVWVVKPECQQVRGGMVAHLPYVLAP
jgi:hypothetical protein